MKAPSVPSLLAISALLIAYCTMCFWFSPEGEIEHPDMPIVRSAAKSYLDADDLRVLAYEGHGGGGDSVWWARVRLLDARRAAPYPPDSLEALVKKRRFMNYVQGYMTRGELAKMHGSVPSWWKADQIIYSVRQKGDSGGFFASPGGTAGEWYIMEYSR